MGGRAPGAPPLDPPMCTISCSLQKLLSPKYWTNAQVNIFDKLTFPRQTHDTFSSGGSRISPGRGHEPYILPYFLEKNINF